MWSWSIIYLKEHISFIFCPLKYNLIFVKKFLARFFNSFKSDHLKSFLVQVHQIRSCSTQWHEESNGLVFSFLRSLDDSFQLSYQLGVHLILLPRGEIVFPELIPSWNTITMQKIRWQSKKMDLWKKLKKTDH